MTGKVRFMNDKSYSKRPTSSSTYKAKSNRSKRPQSALIINAPIGDPKFKGITTPKSTMQVNKELKMKGFTKTG